MVKTGLYSPEFEHDACGIGFVANIKSNKSHQIVSDALTILENMEHRGACGCENRPRMNSSSTNASASVSTCPPMGNTA